MPLREEVLLNWDIKCVDKSSLHINPAVKEINQFAIGTLPVMHEP